MTAGRRFVIAAAVISLVGLAIRVGFVLTIDIPRLTFSDAENFHRLANNLADGEGYVRPVDFDLFDLRRPTAEYPPLFPAYLALWSLAGARTFGAHQLAACLLGAAAIFVVAVTARDVANAATGLVAGIIAALHPMLFQADAALMSESAYAPLVALVLFLVVKARRNPSAGWWACAGAAGGAAALARGEGLLLVALVVAPSALVARDVSVRRRFAFAATVGFAAILVVAPWTVRNAIVFERVIPVSTNMWTVIGGANCPETYRGVYKGWWLFSCFERATTDGASEVEMYAAQQRHAVAFARENLGELPGVIGARVLRVWGVYDADQAALEATEGRSEVWQRAGTKISFALFTLAIVGGVMIKRAGRPLWPFAAMFVIATLVAATTYGNQRFRIQADVASTVLAAVAVGGAVERVKAVLWRR